MSDPDDRVNSTTSAKTTKGYMCWLCGSEFAQRVDLDLHLSDNCSHVSASKHKDYTHYLEAVQESTYAKDSNVPLDTSNLESSTLTENFVARKHSCIFCFKQFKQKYKLQRHLNTCTSLYNSIRKQLGAIVPIEKKYACELCHTLFTRKDHLQRHVSTVCAPNDIKQLYICFLCGSEFFVKDKLIRHIYSTNKHITNAQQIFNCILCNYKFLRKDKLQAHLKRHYIKEQKQHQCLSCLNWFSSSSELSFHLFDGGYDENVYICCVCKAMFSNRLKLKRHLNHGNSERKLYICFICDILCVKKDVLEKHMLTKHIKDEVYHLEEIKTVGDDVEHSLKVKPFVCDICNYVLIDQQSYILHMQNHCFSDDVAVDVKLEVQDY